MKISISRIKILKIVLSISFWLFVWFALSKTTNNELILPKPSSVIKELLMLLKNKEFYMVTFHSLIRILIGYSFGVFIAIILAFLTSNSETMRIVLSPMIKTTRAMPVASFIILALLWLGKTRVPVLIVSLIVFPLIWENIINELNVVDKDLLEMSKAYKLSNYQKLRYIYIPSIMPGFISGCINAMGLAWKSGIAAEVLAQPSYAIGTNLYYSKVYLETAELFAWTLVVVLLSIIIENIIKRQALRNKQDANR